MTLRLQLLLLSLLTLLLPWGGCRYARELETVLRDGEQQALLASATTLANVLAADAQPTGISHDSNPLTRTPFDPAAGDLYVYRLHSRPLLDGYADEWGLPPEAFQRSAAPDEQLAVRYLAGTDGQNLYLLLEVRDSNVRLEQTADARLAPQARADHVRLSVQTDDGREHTYLFITSAPGLISARRPTVSEFGEPGEQTEPRIQAWWQPDHQGYRLELRAPLSMMSGRVGFEAVDIGTAAQGTAEPLRAGTLDPERKPRGRLILPDAALEQRLATLLPPAMRAIVSDRNGRILAEAGALERDAQNRYPADIEQATRPAEWLQTIYRRLLESESALPNRPLLPGRIAGKHTLAALAGGKGTAWFRLPDEHRSVLAVAVPLPDLAQQQSSPSAMPLEQTSTAKPTRILGVLILEQAGDRLLVLRDRALTRLLNFSLIVSGAAVLAMLGFASVLGFRLARLKRAAETALTRDGRVNVRIPETASADELGDVARSFEALLKRLNEYTQYLRTLAGKLSHELRTPLAIVRSSIENIEENQKLGTVIAENHAYLQRAHEGTERLQNILTAMGAATRTEEAIQQAERSLFDLTALVTSAARAYADAFPTKHFTHRLPSQRCDLRGAPDLIVQLLDKLVDNAVDFSAPGTPVQIELDATPTEATLAVINEGPPIPESLRERLFESMFELRRGDASGKPHFGLGLYIVRLIAEFHHGEFFAENLAGRPAVRVGVRLPRPPV